MEDKINTDKINAAVFEIMHILNTLNKTEKHLAMWRIVNIWLAVLIETNIKLKEGSC